MVVLFNLPDQREAAMIAWQVEAQEQVPRHWLAEALQTVHERPVVSVQEGERREEREKPVEPTEVIQGDAGLPSEAAPFSSSEQPVRMAPLRPTLDLVGALPLAPEQLALMPGNITTLEEVETAPDGSSGIRIQYPASAQYAGVQGRVLLGFVIETDGRTSDIHVLQTLHPACDSAAVRAIRKARFVPARQNGQPVRVWVRLPVRYVLVGS